LAGKARVHELAKDLGVESKIVLAKLKEMGEFVKSASSTVDAPVAQRIRAEFNQGELDQRIHRAMVDRRYQDAATDLRSLQGSSPEIYDKLASEIGGLIALHDAAGRPADGRVDWLSGLWARLTAADGNPSPPDTRPRPPVLRRPSAPRPHEMPPQNTRNSYSGTLRPQLRPEEIGRLLETAFVALLRKLFALGDKTETAILIRLRQQRSGSQFGHDVEFDTHDLTGKAYCHVECKNYKETVTLDHIAAKILQTDFHWRDKPLDHFIIVSPHHDASNELSMMIQGWNRRRSFPFDVQLWSPERGVRELFRLAPEVYERIYGERSEVLTAEEEAILGDRWRALVRPVVRLPASWLHYLRTPAEHLVYGEDAHFEEVRADPIELHALSESGAPIAGSLDTAVREWLDEPGGEQSLLLLAEFGDGKSFFSYRLGVELGQDFLNRPGEGCVALRIPLRLLREARSPSDLLAKRLADIASNIAEWRTISHAFRTLVILDGFDEMSARIDPEALNQNVKLLAGCIKHFPGSKVLITSRTHFFDHVKDYQSFLDHIGQPRIIRIAPIPRERRLDYLLQYAKRTGAEEKLQQLKRLYDPIGLAAKPLFLQMIKATLPTLPADHFDEVVLYRQYISDSLERKLDDLLPESRSDQKGIVGNLRAVLEELAVSLHTSQIDYVSLRQFSMGRTHNLAEVLWRMSDGVDSDTAVSGVDGLDGRDARSRIGVRSLLKPVRGVDVDLWPVDFFHRSMREYFVARAIVRSIARNDRRAVELLSRVPLQPEIVNFAVLLMRNPVDVSPDDDARSLALKLDSLARSATLALYGGEHLGGNALTLLYALTGELPHKNWSGLALDYVYLAGANLDGMSFRGSSLRHANLDNTSLAAADFRDADLTGVQLEETAPVLALTLDDDSNTVYAAYGDNSVRRWTVGPGGRATCSTVAQLEFSPRTLDLSSQKDLIVSGGQYMSVLSASRADDSWQIISTFDLRADVQSFSVNGALVGILRQSPQGDVGLELYDPAARRVKASVDTRDTNLQFRFVDERTAFVCESPADVNLHLSIGGSAHSVHAIPIQRAASLDARSLDDRHALLLVGHETGEIALWKVTIDPKDPQATELWRVRDAHAGSVTAVRISGGLILSGGMDRAMCLFPLMDQWQVGTPLRLHRTLRCEEMLVEGVRGRRERELLEALIEGRRQPTTQSAPWTPADLAAYLRSRPRQGRTTDSGAVGPPYGA
jgi:hypothetical protein